MVSGLLPRHKRSSVGGANGAAGGKTYIDDEVPSPAAVGTQLGAPGPGPGSTNGADTAAGLPVAAASALAAPAATVTALPSTPPPMPSGAPPASPVTPPAAGSPARAAPAPPAALQLLPPVGPGAVSTAAVPAMAAVPVASVAPASVVQADAPTAGVPHPMTRTRSQVPLCTIFCYHGTGGQCL
ncbi:hypothetical protein I4F81_003717 [Pyropia yezoensis]|uniref:Uncharacterized protein n=1 Tax=Pyropia yezoensis TaxID=2788 RepID=A0ACC3BU58_PYRYE|nr:hypothetical protein I4F81_003717 [Neopyropia yezoensis]